MDVHEEIERLAEMFIAGELSEEEDREVAAHAEECVDCAAALEAAEAAARTPEPFWRSSGFARAAKGVVAAAVLAGAGPAGQRLQGWPGRGLDAGRARRTSPQHKLPATAP